MSTQEPRRMSLDIIIPDDLKNIHKRMKYAGKQLYIVGGAVRDTLLNKVPKDYDLATDALPDKVIQILQRDGSLKLDLTGESFGVVRAKTREGNEYEIATFREDIGSGRRPDSVRYTTIEDDVRRRDLTVNALFYDMDSGEVVDYVGGIDDISDGVIKAVGDPRERFDEDKLRILRAVRFAGRMGSELDPETSSAIKEDPFLDQVSNERIRDEFKKGVESALIPSGYLKMVEEHKLFEEIFPGLGVNTTYADSKDFPVQLSLLLRDNSPDDNKRVLKAMKYTKEEIKQVAFLTGFMNLSIETAHSLKRAYATAGLTVAQLREFGAEAAAPSAEEREAFIKFAKAPPAVTGRELMDQGFKGPEIGDAMAKAEADAYRTLIGESAIRFVVNRYLRESIDESPGLSLHVYDFDSTLFRSPDPPGWFRARAGEWFKDVRSLIAPCVPWSPGAEWWNSEVVASARASISNPDVYAIMMTGRRDNGDMRFRIAELLESAGLNFDEVHLKPSGDTALFKLSMMKKILSRHRNITNVAIWDDRVHHLEMFRDSLSSMGLNVGVTPVSEPPHPIQCGEEEYYSIEEAATLYKSMMDV